MKSSFGKAKDDNTIGGVDKMSGRNDGNAKSRGRQDLASKHPARLDQFADDMFGKDDRKAQDEDITSRREK